MAKPKSIFVTRAIEELPLLQAYCAQIGIRLQGESLIDFSAIKADIPTDMEVLFLGSRQAMKYFVRAAEVQAESGKAINWNFEIACIGEATARQIEKMGYTVDFAGTKSSDPLSVAKELEVWLANRKLHIALSAQSNRSMSNYLSKSQTEEFIVYETTSKSIKMNGLFDLIAFSSPSNLKSYLVENAIPSETKIIAWGKTTEKFLNNMGFHANYTLQNGLERELIEIIESM